MQSIYSTIQTAKAVLPIYYRFNEFYAFTPLSRA